MKSQRFLQFQEKIGTTDKQQVVDGRCAVDTTTQQALYNNHYLKRYFSYFDIPNNMYQGSLTVEKRDDNEYYIEFRNVSFKYPHTEAKL